MKKSRFVTGLPKALFYARMSLESAWRFLGLIREPGGIMAYFRLLSRASKFTRLFFPHKLVRLADGRHKLDFYMPAYPSEAFFRAMEAKLVCSPPRPVSVVLSITKACRHRCPHCYQRRDDAGELPLDRLVAVVRELREFGVVAWAVEGGEPLLRFDRLEAVLREIKGLEVWVNSTGTGSSPEKISRFKELDVTGVMSSIHSLDPAEHDAFTGSPGSWGRAMEFLRECGGAGMLTGFNTILSDERILAGDIDRIMALASEHDCDYVQLIHPKACGGWMGRDSDPELSLKAVEAARAAQRKYNSSKAGRAPVLTAQVFEESPEMLGCTGGGVDRFYIGSAGDVQPCEFVNLSFGNLNEVGFKTAYERMRATFPVPCVEWTCVSRAKEISEAFKANGVETTPLPWTLTERLARDWKRHGSPTEIYRKMGIYQ